MVLEPQQDMREQILDAATRQFGESGYDGTSLQGIAAAVGIKKPSLLYHFGSKEVLHQAVLRRLFLHWQEVMPRLLQVATRGSGAGPARFDAVVGEILSFFRDDANRARLLVREILDRPYALRVLMVEHVSPWVTILEGYIRRGEAEGVIRRGVDARAYMAQVIQLMINGLACEAVIGGLLGEELAAQERLDRLVAETIRMARVSLFVDAASGGV
jgi:TetR/AcrR family transcriptional regulator